MSRQPSRGNLPRLKPHPRLFRIVCILFALWILALLVMYFLTVYTQRHPHG